MIPCMRSRYLRGNSLIASIPSAYVHMGCWYQCCPEMEWDVIDTPLNNTSFFPDTSDLFSHWLPKYHPPSLIQHYPRYQPLPLINPRPRYQLTPTQKKNPPRKRCYRLTCKVRLLSTLQTTYSSFPSPWACHCCIPLTQVR